jgi:hypothetical protein
MTVLGLMLAGIVGVPVVTACVVHGWHGLRGTAPGPAGPLLLALVSVVLGRSVGRSTAPRRRAGRST